MADRVAALDGALVLRSAPAGGTMVSFSLPLLARVAKTASPNQVGVG